MSKKAILSRKATRRFSSTQIARQATFSPGKPWLPPNGARVLLIGDTHFPFHNEEWLAWVVGLSHEIKPDVIVQVGDLYDQYSQSKFPRSHNVMTPAEETRAARAMAQTMWANLYRAAERVQFYGNHDDRMLKRIREAAPEVEHLAVDAVKALYSFPGVETFASTDVADIDGTLVMHGYLGVGQHALHNLQNTACGHTHKGGLYVYQNVHGCFWELAVGCGVDVNHAAFGYRGQRAIHKIHLGVGLVDALGPRFIPFIPR